MSDFLRSATGRLVMTVLFGAASMVVGIVGANALSGSADPGGAMAPAAILIGEPDAVEVESVDVLAPIFQTPLDDTTLETVEGLLAGPPSGDEPSSPISPSVGTVELPVVNPASGATTDPESGNPGSGETPTDDEPAGFYLPLLRLFVPDQPAASDPCADASSENCPPGVGSTVLGAYGRPNVGWLVDGHITSAAYGAAQCPAGYEPAGDGESGVTLYTESPLTQAEILYRPYPTSRFGRPGPWSSMDLAPATHPGYAEEWHRLLDSLGVGAPYVARCFEVSRDLDQPYEIKAIVTNEEDTTFETPVTLLADQSPDMRPLTTVNRFGNEATISVWSVTGGDVEVRSAVWVPGEKPDCRTEGRTIDTRTFRNQVPEPIGVADPDFTWRHDARIGIEPGTSELVCITLYNSDNRFDVLAEETITLYSFGLWNPRIVAERVWVFTGAITPPELNVEVDWWCNDGGTDQLRDSEDGFHSAQNIEIWKCLAVHEKPPLDRGGILQVPITVTHQTDGGAPIVDRFAIPVNAKICDACAGPFPSVHTRSLPSGEGRPTGFTSYWVFYDWIAGTAPPGSEGWRTDRFTIVTPDDESDPLEVEWEHDLDLDTASGFTDDAVTLFTNRPVRITSVRFLEVGEDERGASCRTAFSGLAPDEFSPATPSSITNRFLIEDLCPGMTYDVIVTAVDDAGFSHELTTFDADALVRVPPLGATYAVQIEFLTNEHAALHVSELELQIDGARPFERFDPLLDGRRNPGPTCHDVDDGVVTFVGWAGSVDPFGQSATRLYAYGRGLDVWLNFYIPNVGVDGGPGCDVATERSGFGFGVSIPLSRLNGVSSNPGVGGSAGALGNTLVLERSFEEYGGPVVRITLTPHSLGTTWRHDTPGFGF